MRIKAPPNQEFFLDINYTKWILKVLQITNFSQFLLITTVNTLYYFDEMQVIVGQFSQTICEIAMKNIGIWREETL